MAWRLQPAGSYARNVGGASRTKPTAPAAPLVVVGILEIGTHVWEVDVHKGDQKPVAKSGSRVDAWAEVASMAAYVTGDACGPHDDAIDEEVKARLCVMQRPVSQLPHASPASLVSAQSNFQSASRHPKCAGCRLCMFRSLHQPSY